MSRSGHSDTKKILNPRKQAEESQKDEEEPGSTMNLAGEMGSIENEVSKD